MKLHTCIRKTATWAGALIAAIVLAACVTTHLHPMGGTLRNGWTLALADGLFHAEYGSGGVPRAADFRDWFFKAGWQWWPYAKCTSSGSYICFPLWLLGFAAASQSAISAYLRRRSRKRDGASRTRCSHCRYDRTGLAANAACPECGAAARQDAAAR